MTTKIELGSMLVVVDGRAAKLFRRGRDGKFSPRHLTFYFEPQGAAYTPHVTDPRKPPGERRTFLPRIGAARLVEVMRGIGDDIGYTWVSKSRHVELRALQDENWLVLFPKDDTVQSVIKALKVRDGRYRLKRSPMTEFFLMMLDESIEPLDLEEQTPPNQPLLAIRAKDDDAFDSTYLSHYPRGLNGPPGWYATPRDWLGPDDEVFTEIMFRHLPREFWEGFRQAARLLGLPFDEQRVAADLARYRPRD